MHKPKLLKVYCCAECLEVEVKTITPKIRGCKKASFHRWVCMGERGEDKYVCNVCNIKINTNTIPSQYGCLGGKFHHWAKI